MKKRILTAFALVAFMILVFVTKSVTTYVFDAFIVYMAVVAGIEMSNLLVKFGFYNSKPAVICYPLFAYGLFKLSIYKQISIYMIIVLQIALIILFAGLVTLVCLLAKKRSDNEMKTRKLNCSYSQFALFKGVQTLFAILYPSFIVTLLLYINNIEGMTYIFASAESFAYSISLFFLVYTFVVPVFTDTFAMLTGALFKGKKLCENISPNKTISGAIGGVLWGTISSVALFFIFNSIDKFRIIFINLGLTWWIMLIVGFVSSILCQLGDIFESWLKRKAQVKDSGDILPGHGGILDRIDSHLVNMIITFVFMLIVLL